MDQKTTEIGNEGDGARAERNSGQDARKRQADAREVEDRSSPPTPVIYAVVRKLGEEEMARPAISLWWSGFAAGLSISLSLLAQAILQSRLPDAPWRPLIADFGYCVGFIVAILSRQQLFTENTITAVLPVLAEFDFGNVVKLVRLWCIVFVANMAGALCAALFFDLTPVFEPGLKQEMLNISLHIQNHGWPEMLFKAIAAGFLMAALVWMLPGAEAAQFQVIAMMTWLIVAGGLMHIVAGGVEAFMLVLDGAVGWGAMLAQFGLPVLFGNIIGGTALFALLAYAQVMREI
ncbi:formate/nitrite transporter family protein [Rhodoblastus sp.]|uniref:formate/nitrite transporter family protein n=1 Tax=Rhodoblastus sp. TaxID=1962975 RepID=UPI003F9D841B